MRRATVRRDDRRLRGCGPHVGETDQVTVGAARGTPGEDTRVGYRDVLRNREFTALYASQSLSLLGDQLARIALAILVYDRTGSPLAASATFAASYLAYLVGGPLLSTLSDRYPRLTVMVGCDLLRAPAVLLLCLHGVPLWGVFGLVVLLGALAPPFDSARGALQPDLLEGEAYVVGNALMTLTVQLGQVLGFVVGGTVVALTSVQGALALDAATFLVSAGLLLLGVRHRPAAQRREDRGGVLHDTLEALRLVVRTPGLRDPLLLALLASVAVTATEGLAIPVVADLGGGALAAGLLTAAAPAGFLVGSVLVLRVTSERRLGLLPGLVALACMPLLLTPLLSTVPALLVLWAVAGAGLSVNLIAGPTFMQRLPREARGRGYAVAATCLQVGQGLGLLAAGVLADLIGPRPAVAVLAAACALLAASARRAQGNSRIVR